ncbi:MAG TPA: hypothetical protein VGR32_13105 [Brevundimonas sp.]|jgi:hypothetical protein|uniref:hypothetical protein n=1 Tax=Brevundimonas sp. TaxID=1871086 RepID=UPI002DF6D2BF|nr:hypothetical protein [Brevundimonas sp.]
MKRLVLLSVWFAVAACSQGEDPAAPAEPSPVPPVDGETSVPGPNAGNFVGAWAAQASWCANTSGPERPIRITTTTFEGYENSCRISRVQQVNTAYEALLDCTSEGTTTQERVRMRVADDRLTLSWLDRAGSSSSEFVRCPAVQPAPVPIPAPEPTG